MKAAELVVVPLAHGLSAIYVLRAKPQPPPPDPGADQRPAQQEDDSCPF